MTARVLTPEEWPKVAELEITALLPFVRPEDIAVVVVEADDGTLLASMTVMRMVHFEGVWIHPEHRTAGVTRKLLKGATAVAKEWNEQWVLGGAADGDDRMREICMRLGGSLLPMSFYSLPLNGGSSCRQPS